MPGLTSATVGRCFQTLDLPQAEVILYPAFFSAPEADRLLRELRDTTAWRQESITLYGKTIEVPRRTAWYGDEGTRYIYSGITNVPLPWTPALMEVKRAVEPPAGVAFNSVLLNRYRTGQDSVSWHADDEPVLGENPVIASVSLGAVRRFRLRHKRLRSLVIALDLPHGSCLVMAGATQHCWVHEVPKTARPVGPRINLTFRRCRAEP